MINRGPDRTDMGDHAVYSDGSSYIRKRLLIREREEEDAKKKLAKKASVMLVNDAFFGETGTWKFERPPDIRFEQPLELVWLFSGWGPYDLEDFLTERVGNRIKRWDPWWVQDFTSKDGPCYRWNFVDIELFYFPENERLEYGD